MSTSRAVVAIARAAIALAALLTCTSCAPVAASIHGEVAHPVTRDGWPLTVEHFAPAPGAVARRRPVILCHGVVSNRHFFEVEGEESLPAVLARDGFDVWVVDMRGRDDAGAPGWYFGHHTYDYDIDDYVREDVDALLTYVVARTGAPDVAWVGHSLGGMIAYARLGTIGDSRIGALVTVGSPGFFAPLSHHLLRFYELSPALSLLPVLPTAPAARLDGALGLPLAPAILEETIFTADSIPPATYRALERDGVTNAAKPELRQFLRGLRAGEFVSRDGSVSYTRALSAIHTPALVIVGRADELADPLVGRGVFERLGSSDKELVVAGRGEGFSIDFGHVDLLVGPAAHREIFPRIVGWLEGHDGGATAPATADAPVLHTDVQGDAPQMRATYFPPKVPRARRRDVPLIVAEPVFFRRELLNTGPGGGLVAYLQDAGFPVWMVWADSPSPPGASALGRGIAQTVDAIATQTGARVFDLLGLSMGAEGTLRALDLLTRPGSPVAIQRVAFLGGGFDFAYPHGTASRMKSLHRPDDATPWLGAVPPTEDDALLPSSTRFPFVSRLTRLPVLFVSGKADGIAPSESAFPLYTLWGSDEPDPRRVPKLFFLAGRENNLGWDSDHFDLFAGPHAERVWSHVVTWLERD